MEFHLKILLNGVSFKDTARQQIQNNIFSVFVKGTEGDVNM